MDKDTRKRVGTEIVLEVVAEQAADVIKEQGLTVLGEILTDAVASMVPGLGGAVVSYRTAKLKRNIEEIERLLVGRVDELKDIFYSKSVQQQSDIDRLYEHMLSNALDEPQREKIEYFINGFINIAQCETINEDFVLIFYDLLRELRLVDLTVLKLYGRFYLNEENAEINKYDDVLSKHNITYEQYNLVRQNLVKKGVLTSKTDLTLEKDLKAIEEAIKELQNYAELITNPKKNKYPRLKSLKLQYNDRFELTKFGREFIKFIINANYLE
ncbi:hypothetical protein WMO40_19825 [Bacillaceae bacterium CLA-AA-H227]|uniref:Uncharacterized protein n=1 Tax=Robertmurraya yapensis (ex Hitch et al 2024) TaxID=3133160 RepID=A0ACC6SIK2_9BACI